MGIRTERTGEIYHLVGFNGRSNGAFFSRDDYLEGRVEIEEKGNYERKIAPGDFGHVYNVAFNQDADASPDPLTEGTRKISFKHWNRIGRPIKLERVVVKTERNMLLQLDSTID